jgi:hypothetical protein
MKPYLHALISSKRFGGKPEDYLEIHDFMDSSKAHLADARHRMFLHNSFGIYLAERVCGEIVDNQRMPYITISDGRKVQVRDVAEQHVLDDLGYIPSLSDCVKDLPIPGEIAAISPKRRIKIGDKVVTMEQLINGN